MDNTAMATNNGRLKNVLTMDNMNPNVRVMEYAVRGALAIRACELEKEIKEGVHKSFEEVIKANIGNSQALGQKPISFIREILSICCLPKLIDSDIFPLDVRSRALRYLDGCAGHSVGSYSESSGLEIIRKDVAKFIAERDGFPCDYSNIVLCAGASSGIRSWLQMFCCQVDKKPTGVMIPIPQYPLYSATIAEFGLHQVNYYLDESNEWALDVQELQRALNEGRKISAPRVLCVINPGNPTGLSVCLILTSNYSLGQVLSRSNIEEIIKFAYAENLFLFADEVYQHNIYDRSRHFHSFKKVLFEMGEPYINIELVSFMSASKGFMGECGLRGGYVEMHNIDPYVKTMYLKCISARLCPTTLGQITIGAIVNPPVPGEHSYDSFEKEKKSVLNDLAERSQLVYTALNEIEGISCNPLQGAMYAFPQIKIPLKAQEVAREKCLAPDAFWAMELLNNTGICVVPGSGFGQKQETFHFRTTILPPTTQLKKMLARIKEFHLNFLSQYS